VVREIDFLAIKIFPRDFLLYLLCGEQLLGHQLIQHFNWCSRFQRFITNLLDFSIYL